MIKRLAILSLLAILLAGISPMQAQDGDHLDDEQRAALAVVNAAIGNMLSLESYAVRVEIHDARVIQGVDMPAYHTVRDTRFDAVSAFDADHRIHTAQVDLHVVHTTMTPDEDGEAALTMEVDSALVLLGSDVYLRAKVTAPEAAQPFDDETLRALDQWRHLTADEFAVIMRGEHGVRTYGLILMIMPVMHSADGDGFHMPGTQLASYAAGDVLRVTELDRATLHDRSMRVFELALDPFPLMLRNAEQVAAQFGGESVSTKYDAATLEAVTRLMREDVSYTVRLWIGVEDQLVHQIVYVTQEDYDTGAIRAAVPALQDTDLWPSDDLMIVTDAQSTVTYSALGAPVEVAAPASAGSLLDWFSTAY